jgi:hypothetical protein
LESHISHIFSGKEGAGRAAETAGHLQQSNSPAIGASKVRKITKYSLSKDDIFSLHSCSISEESW